MAAVLPAPAPVTAAAGAVGVPNGSRLDVDAGGGISELSGWDLELPRRQEPAEIQVEKSYGPGEAPIERLPVEVLGEFN